MIGVPDTRYACTRGVHIAYQVFGEGPFDLLFVSHPTDPIELLWDDPLAAAALRRLGSVARVMLLDLRGAGSSDAVNVDQLSRAEAWVDDLVAVMDAAGSSEAAVVAIGEVAHPAMLLAATHPARVRALALINSCARFVRAHDYPQGAPAEVADWLIERYAQQMGTQSYSADAEPARAGDPVFVRWRGRAARLAGAPGTMSRLYSFFLHTDSRSALELIQAPTLVLHRADNRYIRVAHGRHLADHIPDARLVELPGADQSWYSGDVDAVVDELVGFLTGARASAPTSRHLATVLFTDIVGSTERAVELGDRRWAATLAGHNEIVSGHVSGFRGRLVKLTGDGALAVFDGPARAIHCAEGVRGALDSQGLQIRAGVHTGEVELLGDDVGGVAVHVAARIMALAEPGELLASGVLPPLVLGSGIEFRDRGSHALKGLDGTWPVVAVALS